MNPQIHNPHDKFFKEVFSEIQIASDIRNGTAAKYSQRLNYEFFDLSHIPDSQITGTVILKIILFTLKYIRRMDFLTKIDDILVMFNELPAGSDLKQYLYVFTVYIQNAALVSIRQELIKKIIAWVKNGDSNMNKVFEELKKEGKKEGKREGILEGKIEGKIEDARNMLSKGMDIKIIHEITGLSKKQITELKKDV